MRIVAATGNPAKLEELRRLFAGLGDVEQSPCAAQESERGETVEAVAAAKACAWSRVNPGVLVAATDGGLLIPALGERWSPVRTRRFAGDGVADEERARRLLELAGGLTGDARAIGWREAVALARDGRVIRRWSAESVPGLLAEAVDRDAIERGGGFWVPAVWRCPERGGRLLADLMPAERATRDDHWRRLRQLADADWPAVVAELG